MKYAIRSFLVLVALVAALGFIWPLRTMGPENYTPRLTFKIGEEDLLDNAEKAALKAEFEQNAESVQGDVRQNPAARTSVAEPPPEEEIYGEGDGAEAPPPPANAVVITGLGLDPAYTAKVLAEAPKDVALGFSPYAPNLGEVLKTAKASGREVYVELPVQDGVYPRHDPGTLGLMQDIEVEEKAVRFDRINVHKASLTGYFSVIPDMWAADQTARNALVYLTQPNVNIGANLTDDAVRKTLFDIAQPKAPSLIFVDAKPGLVGMVLAWLPGTTVVAPSKLVR